MKASEAKTGHKYLTPKGAAVTVTGEKNGKILLKLPTGVVFRCGPDYELKPPKAAPEPKPAGTKPSREGSLAAIIDPLLIAGGHTVKEIAEAARANAAEATQGKDVEANVRARMVGYTRKGWRVVKYESKRVKVVQGK